MANKDTAKTWFETGDFPTQSQFWQVFDWLRWKDEPLVAGDLSAELVALLNLVAGLAPAAVSVTGLTGMYTIPAGYAVHRLYANISAGFAILSVTDETEALVYVDDTRIDVGVTTAVDATILADAATTIYLNIDSADPLVTTTFKIYLHKI